MIDQEIPVATHTLRQQETIVLRTPEATYEVSYVDGQLCIHIPDPRIIMTSHSEEEDHTIVIAPDMDAQVSHTEALKAALEKEGMARRSSFDRISLAIEEKVAK